MKSRVKEFREELGLTQQELANRVGVSRQTIYYLEKGNYNPSLTLSFKIAEILNKPLIETFYRVPIIKDKIESLSFKKLKEISKKVGISYNKLGSITEMNEKELSEAFDEEILRKIANLLELDFNELFIN
ncbi:MAG: transcriptional regulator [Promethearchaeota archaeon]|nr:MAG: transcriptional regulator [Candidatus Lokiarchaeota archaeon]